MGRVRLILLLASATALVALSAPAAAVAGAYSWSLPEDPGTFTGSNPEQKYNANSWTYQVDGSNFPSGDFHTSGVDGGPGWTDGSGDNIADIGSAIKLDAAIGHSVTLAWTNPLTVPVTVTDTFSAGGMPLCNLSSPSSTVDPGGTVSITLMGSIGCSATGTISLQGTTPPLTLTSPGNGSTFTTGQPIFSGTASTAVGASNTVTVLVYEVGAALAETLTTTPSGGSYSAVPTTALPNGQYTAIAEQDDPVGAPNYSSAVTFVLNNVGPSLTLDSLGSRPLSTSTPTFTGTAGTRQEDGKSLGIAIWSGSSISGPATATVTGSVGSGGRFSIQSPSLPDGRYTAVVGQLGSGLVGLSSPMTFRIKVHPPALIVSHPSAGGSIRRSSVFFWGQAGDALGDSSTISVALYRGTNARGKAGGRRTIRVSGSRWSVGWGRKLKNGFYTLSATQTDDAGHTTRIAHTFLVVPGPSTIGSFVSLSRSGVASVPIECVASSGTCSGTVLVVTKRSFHTAAGGPSRRLRVLFAYVRIPAGKTQTIRGTVPGSVVHTLRRNRGTSVRITAALSRTGTTSTTRSLKLG